MTAIEYLIEQLKEAAPAVCGVSIGKWNDKSTWRVHVSETTQDEQARIDHVIEWFDKAQFEASQPVVITIEQRLADLEARLAYLESKT